MSRSNNTELINPSTRYYEWQGSTGKLKYFDKSLGEKGENVIVDLPFTFLVLDRLATIKGYSDSDQSGFWSNEVRDTRTEMFTVKTKKGTVTTALYKDLAPILNLGACYSQSVYIAYYDTNKKLVIGNIQMNGSAIGEWITFCKGKDLYKCAVKIESATPAKKGATNYFTPVFKALPVSEETNAAAIALDKELQEYLTAYFNRNKEATPHVVEQEFKPVSNGHPDGRPAPHRNGAGEVLPPYETTFTAEPVDAVDDLPF